MKNILIIAGIVAGSLATVGVLVGVIALMASRDINPIASVGMLFGWAVLASLVAEISAKTNLQ